MKSSLLCYKLDSKILPERLTGWSGECASVKSQFLLSVYVPHPHIRTHIHVLVLCIQYHKNSFFPNVMTEKQFMSEAECLSQTSFTVMVRHEGLCSCNLYLHLLLCYFFLSLHFTPSDDGDLPSPTSNHSDTSTEHHPPTFNSA